jgi:ribosomal protein S18 acetylase RimI-like enzyme
MQIDIRPFTPEDRATCAAILSRLSEWFGIPESNAAYLRGLGELPSFVAVADGRVVAFVSLRTHFPESAEIEVLAVDPEFHRRGIGARLLERVELALARPSGARLLHVKTLGPSDPDPGYARTRAFYLRLGFVPLFESDVLFGNENPALVLVKVLPATDAAAL